MRIAMVGTRGVPARYGGFETAVEEIGQRLVGRGHRVTVYCRRVPGAEATPSTHLGMDLVHLPAARRRALETLTHTGLSTAHLLAHRPDAVLLFNAANSVHLPALRAARLPVATHVDGLEWKRAKWGAGGRRYYRAAESMAVRWSDALIADAQGISDYYADEFGAATELIAYGAPVLADLRPHRLAELGLEPGRYHLVVARFEPENHLDVMVEGYVASGAVDPLVVVGSAPYSDAYTARVHALADDRVRLLGAVWDQDLLDQLYGHSLTYLHGHSVGGTNPSLLRAAGAGAAVDAFDVSFNREVLGDQGRYWSRADDVTRLVDAAAADRDGTLARGRATVERAAAYDWDDVALAYEDLCRRLVARALPQRRPSGRRSGVEIRRSPSAAPVLGTVPAARTEPVVDVPLAPAVPPAPRLPVDAPAAPL